jgi:hypothetical protein
MLRLKLGEEVAPQISRGPHVGPLELEFVFLRNAKYDNEAYCIKVSRVALHL